MNNFKYSQELYEEIQSDEGCIYDEDIKEEMFENMFSDYL